MRAVKQRQRYTKEFKLEAVRLAENSDKSKRQIALEIGVSDILLYKWCKDFKKDKEGAFKQGCEPKTPEQEIHRLRMELERVKVERDILKKAAAYFAKESL